MTIAKWRSFGIQMPILRERRMYMKRYESPQADVLRLAATDVITTSNGFDVGMDVPAVKDEDWVIGP